MKNFNYPHTFFGFDCKTFSIKTTSLEVDD